MADLSATTLVETRPRGKKSFIIADGVTVYANMLAGLEAGYLNHWADAANEVDVFVGIVVGGEDRADDGVLTGETSDSKPPEARVDTTGATLRGLTVGGTPTQAKVGDLVYCGTSNPSDITLDSSGRTSAIGWMSRYTSATDQEVELFTPAEFLAYQQESPGS